MPSRRPNGRLRLTLLPLAVLTCLSLTACQDDSEPASAPPPSPASSSSSPSEGSTTPPSGEPSASPSLDAVAEAFLDRMSNGMGERGTAHMEMTVGGPAASTSSGDMRYDGRGSEIALTSQLPQLGDKAMEMVVLRDAAYVSIPGVTPAGKFIRIGKDNPRFQELAGASIQMSPAQSVKAFRAGLISVRERGTEQVQGVRTTRYDVKADSVRALQAQGGDAVPGMPATLTYRVWLDGQDHMRRMALDIRGVELTIELSRWNEPVDITAPPKAQVVEAPAGF